MPRRLGQHFLRPASVEKLVRLIDPRPDDAFLEIGPGAGALTLPLAATAREVVAVELDTALARELAARLPPNARVVTADALGADLEGLVPGSGRLRLVGNLPYYVSSPLLRRLLELRGRAFDLHAMLQEEVADRVASPPGSKAYGVLSVLFGLWAELDVPLRFPPASFSPPPKVESAVLRARFRRAPLAAVDDPGGFERLVHRAFAHRRKTLENNLQDSYPNLKENLRLLKIEGMRRAETLSIVEFARLAERLSAR
ncbi:MAG: 16S rRNA (adenine(1518)-N(6)/adenine(1519)-N(6))-dimethyltransferase RsmA [Vicinamibacteria bacterium]